MKRIGFRGDRSWPFEVFVWDDETGVDTIVIGLSPMQTLSLGMACLNGFWSWVQGKKISDPVADPPSSAELP